MQSSEGGTGEMVREFWSPERAAEVLKYHNAGNRRRSERHIRAMADDILHDRWRDTHEPVAFNCDGTLKDGQQRFAAIVLAGKGLWLWTFYGLMDRAAEVIDSGISRTVLHAAQIRGISDVSASLAACARSMYLGIAFTTSRPPLTRSAALDFIQRFSRPIRFAESACMPRMVRLTTAPQRGAFARAWFHSTETNLLRAASLMLNNPVDDGPYPWDESMRSLTRSSLANIGGMGGTPVQVERYGKAARAIRAYIDKKALSKIVMPELDPFPIPGDGLPEDFVGPNGQL